MAGRLRDVGVIGGSYLEVREFCCLGGWEILSCSVEIIEKKFC